MTIKGLEERSSLGPLPLRVTSIVLNPAVPDWPRVLINQVVPLAPLLLTSLLLSLLRRKNQSQKDSTMYYTKESMSNDNTAPGPSWSEVVLVKSNGSERSPVIIGVGGLAWSCGVGGLAWSRGVDGEA